MHSGDVDTKSESTAAANAVAALETQLRSARMDLEREKAVRADLARRVAQLTKQVQYYRNSLELRQQEVRYRLGDALVKALRPSRHTLLLPARIIGLLVDGTKRRAARLPAAARAQLADSGTASSRHPSRKPGAYLFCCIDDLGLDHHWRVCAIMRRVCQMRPDVPVVLASTAETPQLACPDGVVGHSLPRPPPDRSGRPYAKWVARLRKSLATIAREQSAATLICDGTAPWPDLLPGIDRAGVSHAARVLSVRECLSDVPPDHTEWDVFNQITVLDDGAAQMPLDERLPRELIESKVERVEPIIYADPDELEGRAAVRRRWNVRPDQRLAYVQPPDRGAAPWLQRVFHALEAHDDVRAIVSDDTNGRPHAQPPRGLASLSTADARRCWRGLDLAIVTPLYSITHELLHFGVPTVLVADAVGANARARAVSFQRALAAVTVTSAAFLADAIALALSDDVRATLVRRSRERLPTNGAEAAARLIVAASAPTVPSTTP